MAQRRLLVGGKLVPVKAITQKGGNKTRINTILSQEAGTLSPSQLRSRLVAMAADDGTTFQFPTMRDAVKRAHSEAEFLDFFKTAGEGDLTVKSLTEKFGTLPHYKDSLHNNIVDMAKNKIYRHEYIPFLFSIKTRQRGNTPHTSPEQADKLIRKRLHTWLSPYFIRNRRAADRTIIVGDDVFSTLVDRFYAQKAVTLDIKNEAKGSNAFNLLPESTPSSGLVVHANRGNAGTVIHEATHFYAPDDFKNALGNDFNEGVTEYFARIAMAGLGIVRTQYAAAYDVAAALAAKVGNDALGYAYFRGQISNLRIQFLIKTKKKKSENWDARKGDWDEFITAIKAAKWSVAAHYCRL